MAQRLNDIRQLISNNPDKSSFFKLIGTFFPPAGKELRFIELSYDVAERDFSGKIRDDKSGKYFEHLRAVALIVLVYLRIRDPKIIAAALLHDIIEDIDNWTYDRLVLEFGIDVANLVWWVTKPPVTDFEGDKNARNRFFHHRLNGAPREVCIIKLADRLHNLITLWGTDPAKQSRKIQETQDFYLPIAEKHIILIHEIEDALSEVIKSVKND